VDQAGYCLSGCLSSLPYVAPELKLLRYSGWLPETTG